MKLTVARIENLDSSSYKTFRLKRRLKNTFPQLVFHSPEALNRSDIVFAECLETGKVVETYMSQEQLLDSDEETEETHECAAQDWYTTWPPVAADINVANVKKLVPPVIFNFFAWGLGF